MVRGGDRVWGVVRREKRRHVRHGQRLEAAGGQVLDGAGGDGHGAGRDRPGGLCRAHGHVGARTDGHVVGA